MSVEVKSSAIRPATLRGVLRAGLVAVVLTVICNVLIFMISEGILRINFVVLPPPGSLEPFHVTVTSVILDTILMAVGATVVFTLLMRVFTHPNRVFVVISVLILLLSFMFPLLLQVDAPMKIALCLMHIVAAAIIVGLLTRGSRETVNLR
jgi:Family of unknown function (DUF6069)